MRAAGKGRHGRPDARAAAVVLLARRDLASSELRARLEARGYPREDIEAALTILKEERALDDARYAQAQVLSRSERGQGPLRIRDHLLGAGLPPALVEAALAAGPDWAILGAEVRRRRFGVAPPATLADSAQQARFLQYRGFSADHIRQITGAELDLE
jgi:regulatory protein